MIDPAAPSRLSVMREVLAYSDPTNPWVSVYFDEVQRSDGHVGRYNRIVEGQGHPGVAILPILPNGIGLVRVDRYPIGLKVWEIPRGFGDSPDAEANARRELTEETGWVASQLVRLGHVHLNSGLLAGQVVLFAALIDEPKTSGRDSEATSVSVFPLHEVGGAMKSGAIADAATATALLLAQIHGLIATVE